MLDDIKPWRYPATRDFLYGEWLRTDDEAGNLSHRQIDPNLPVVLSSAREHSLALMGPPLAQLTDPVPREHLTQFMDDTLPALVASLAGDERNVLLTLARILYTLRTDAIAPKDVAADHVGPLLEPAHAAILDLAARAYRGEARDDWSTLSSQAAAVAKDMTDLIHALKA